MLAGVSTLQAPTPLAVRAGHAGALLRAVQRAATAVRIAARPGQGVTGDTAVSPEGPAAPATARPSPDCRRAGWFTGPRCPGRCPVRAGRWNI